MRQFRSATDTTTSISAAASVPCGVRPLTAAGESVGSMGHEDHPDIGRTVRDVASGAEGTLTAVVREKVSSPPGCDRFVRLAYIRAGNSVEWSTDPGNIAVIR